MDILVEKLDGSRYYLSQYKVLITDFEESAPSVTRNSKQLDQHNGNIDFGGWHTDKTINITGYYRADDIDEEETLREKLYALLSDPDGYYITQLKATPSVTMERPGETSGGYYDKLNNYPSHKRFLVYTEAPEMELVGNVNGTLLYKLTAEFKTMKLPYGETPARDVAIDSPYKDVPVNLLLWTSKTLNTVTNASGWNNNMPIYSLSDATVNSDMSYTASAWIAPVSYPMYVQISWKDPSGTTLYGSGNIIYAGKSGYSTWENTLHAGSIIQYVTISFREKQQTDSSVSYGEVKLEKSTTASPWSPNPTDPEYNSWYHSLTSNISIPYSGSVPCNQLEQGFAIEMTAKGASSSLSFKIDDTELTYSGAVASGDVFIFSGFSYTQNGLSIVSKTNKAYFILQPDKPNRITCNIPGTVRILGFQNMYA